MSDIEKYGLFAVLFVGGILLLIAVGGGFSDEPPAAGALATGAPVVLDQPATLRTPEGDARSLTAVRVSPLLPTDKPFTWDEPPVAYPGERSAAAPASPVVLEAPGKAEVVPATYIIRSGDTLADIAQRQLGSATRWNELVRLNPGLDPKRLKIGQAIRISGSAPSPPAEPLAAPAPAASKAVAKAEPSSARTHTVASGDTLGGMSKKYLCTVTKADAIFEANRDVLKNPDDLKIGQVLRIP